jgi:hypothetical protein
MTASKPTIHKLRELVEQASRDNPHLTTRLERAAFLLLLRPIMMLGDHYYQVGSEDGLRHYEVLNGHCQCTDYVRHGVGHPCKHRLVLALHQRLGICWPPAPSNPCSTPPVDPLSRDESAY